MNIFRKRPPWRWSSLCLLAGIAGSLSPAHAIDPNRAMSQYIRDRWGPEQGFPRGPVYAITQTPDGYLWIGTEAGLVRFDGMNFRLVQDSAGSNVTSVLGLTPDNEGNLWVRMIGPNMLRFRDGVFENARARPGWPDLNIGAMCRTTQGALLVSIMEHGTYLYKSGKFELIAPVADLPRSPVMSMAQTPDGAIWLGTRDTGLFRLGNGQKRAVTKGLPDPKVNCLLPDGDRGLWVGTDRGIVRWDGKEIVGAGIGASLNRLQALAMVKDRDGNIWVGTDSRGLLRLNSQGVASLDEDGGAGEAVTAVFEDREGNLWTGGASGIERLRDSVFVTYSDTEGMPSKSNGPVYADAQNRAWFAPTEGGLYWLSQGQVGRVTVAGLADDVVYSITGSGDELWVGRQRGGLTRLRSTQGLFEAKTYTQADGLAQNSIYTVHQNRDGTVWAGALTGGVSRLRNGKFTTFTTANGLASNSVSAILESADGAMWFATPDGLSSLAGERWSVHTSRDGLPADSVNCLLEDSRGVLWVGTINGLASRDGAGRFRTLAGGPESLREPIFGLAEDKAGSIWIATANHVLRVNREGFLKGSLHDADFREYGLADGLHGVEGVKRNSSVTADSLGRIWFSMNRGLSVVDPARLANGSPPAIVRVQTVSADGEDIEARNAIRISTPRQRIAFHFAGLSLSVPERIKFRYKLDRFDRGWSEPVTTREAVYTNLNPGSYRFRVVASNADGLWNGTEATVDCEIEPLVWQTWWFRLFGVVACALAGLGIYRFRLHQLTGRLNVRFEERLAERTRIAKELHDTLLQGFLGASMQLHIAADRLPEDSPAKPPVNRILELMGQVIEEGRNAVRGLRLTDTGPDNLAEAFSRIRQEFGAAEEIDFRVIVEGQPRPLHPVLRDEVYRLGREALVNAFRHSRARRMELELEYTRKHLRILVRDNGVGIDSHVLLSGDGYRGLTGMREQAERIGARLHVWSSATAGTEVELTVPGHIAFGRQPSDVSGRWFAKWHGQKGPAGISGVTSGEN